MLVAQADLTKEQAVNSLIIITDFAKEKYPVLRGNISSFLQKEIASSEQIPLN